MTPSDQMGKAALNLALLASKFDFRLLGAANPNMSREQRAESLERALTQWPAMCRAMTELEQFAPTAVAKAAELDAKLQDFVESRA